MSQILFLTQVLPFPLDAGPKIRAYYVLRHLCQRNDVTLVSFIRDDDREDCLEHLQSLCTVHTVPILRSTLRNARALVKAGITGAPTIIVRDELGGMRRLLFDLVRSQSFDVIHADQTSMAQYALFAKSEVPDRKAHASARTLLDAHNALYRVFGQLGSSEPAWLKRQFYRRESRALARYEKRLVEMFDQVTYVTERDRVALEGGTHDGDGSPRVLPICCDLADRAPIQPSPTPRYVTHLGTMFWPPNIDGVLWFAREVWPSVLDRVPQARFQIIGKRPPPEIESLASDFQGVDVSGYVADPTPQLSRTAAFIVPLHAGAGMRVKIIDAWCWGIPIVSTTVGAEGIKARDGEHLLIADDASSFADAVVSLLSEPETRERLRRNGRLWVQERYDWRKVYKQWDSIYASLLSDLG